VAVLAIGALVAPVRASASAPAEAKVTGSITVSAASSLTEGFTQIGKQFQKKFQGTTVTFNFDASSVLVLQIQQGAPADVFASADEANMQKLQDGGQVKAKPVVFTRNKLEIATKPGNPKRIRTLADLATAGTIALCASEVPCGKYADAALAAAGVTIPPEDITRQLNAKATLTAVSAGDAEAAIVYVTDVRSAKSSVTGVPIPPKQNQIAIYPIAPLAASGNPTTAKAFARYVGSPAGQRVLRRLGFRAP
jgi:molybdate transport system substrate-binding protein